MLSQHKYCRAFQKRLNQGIQGVDNSQNALKFGKIGHFRALKNALNG
jgi:hypothetical protein